jgi:AraC-like DNA-binding protein
MIRVNEDRYLDDRLRTSTVSPKRSPHGLALIGEGTLRMAPLLPLPDVLAACGLDAPAVILESGGAPELFDDPENVIGFREMGRLLMHCASAAGMPDLGLETGRRSGLEVLGIIGHLARRAPDVGSALRTIVLYLHLHDRGAVPVLWEGGSQAMLGYVIHRPDVPGIEQIYDGAVAIVFNILRSLAGRDWTASEVWLHRAQPADVGPYRRHFRCRIRFDAPRAAVVFPADDLQRPLETADAPTFERIRDEVETLAAIRGMDLSARVRQVLRRLVVSGIEPGDPQLEQVAKLFAIHGRTLNRRLHAEGTTFKALVAETRYEIARQLLRDTPLPILEIAVALGYRDTTAFSRAFSGWCGTPPAAWRLAHMPDSG